LVSGGGVEEILPVLVPRLLKGNGLSC